MSDVGEWKCLANSECLLIENQKCGKIERTWLKAWKEMKKQICKSLSAPHFIFFLFMETAAAAFAI